MGEVISILWVSETFLSLLHVQFPHGFAWNLYILRDIVLYVQVTDIFLNLLIFNRVFLNIPILKWSNLFLMLSVYFLQFYVMFEIFSWFKMIKPFPCLFRFIYGFCLYLNAWFFQNLFWCKFWGRNLFFQVPDTFFEKVLHQSFEMCRSLDKCIRNTLEISKNTQNSYLF